MKAYGYSRSSAGDMESIHAQEAAIERYCDKSGFPSPDYYFDAETDGSGGMTDRTEGRDLMNIADKGDIIVVATMCRISRDLTYLTRFLRAMVEKGVAVHVCLPEPLVLGPETPCALALVAILEGIAAFGRELIAARDRSKASPESPEGNEAR